jgi:hypothetical protein
MNILKTPTQRPQIGCGIKSLFSILAFAVGFVLLFVTIQQAYCVNEAQAQTTVSQPAPNTPPSPQAKPGQEVVRVNTNYSWQSVALVVLLLALLAFLFRTLISWSAKIEQTSFLGNLYREGIEEREYRLLAYGPNEKLEKGDYRREIATGSWMTENPPPPIDPKLEREINPDPFATIGRRLDYSGSGIPGLGGSNPFSSRRPGGTENEPSKEEAEEAERMRHIRSQYYNQKHIWDNKVLKEERCLYQADLDAQREKAKEKANSAVDIDLTVLRGRTPAFILEFTAVVIIIFAAVSLGILDILKNEQIGTLLAAIAGYVLGRATSRGSEASQPEKSRAPVIPPPAAPAPESK